MPKSPTPLGVIQTISDVDVSWLSAILDAPVTSFHSHPIGTGQVGDCYCIDLEYAGKEAIKSDHNPVFPSPKHIPAGSPSTRVTRPTSLVLKLAAASEATRAGANALGVYAREIRFYNEIAPLFGNRALASCYFAAFDQASGTCSILLSNAHPAVTGDDFAGATIAQATLALAELGRLQATQLECTHAEFAPDWLRRSAPSQAFVEELWPRYLARFGARMLPAHIKVCETFIASFDAWQAARIAPGVTQGLVHGDFRLENMLFGPDDSTARPFTIVDWQTVTRGPLASDLSYFLGGSLAFEDRRAHADALITAYHEALGPNPPWSLEQAKEGVRFHSFFGLVTFLIAPMIFAESERGDDLFMEMMRRHCTHVLDLNALLILPPPGVEP